MKGSQKIIDKLNYLLEGELTAINQYMLHAEMCEDWGYDKLSHGFKHRAIEEMHHAEKLVERILFLEGKPIVSKLSAFSIGKTVPDQVVNDHKMETDTVADYNAAIKLCVKEEDNATKAILEEILADEDRHVDELETMQAQIDQMGLAIFLSIQKPAE